PFLAGPNALRAQFAARQMHAGKIACALRQRHQRILIADIAQINADAGFAVQQLAQFRHRKTVAGVNADNGRALMQERLDLGDESCARFSSCGPSRACVRSPAQTSFSPKAVSAVPLPRWVSTSGTPKKSDHCSTRFQTCR